LPTREALVHRFTKYKMRESYS